MNQKTSSNPKDKTLKVAFLVGVIGSFVIQAVGMGGHIIAQWPTNQNLSGFMWWLVLGFALPILFALVAVVVKREKALSIQNAFDVTLLIVSVILCGSLVSSLVSTIAMNVHIVMTEYLPYFLLYTGLPAAVSTVVFIGILVVLRRKKQW